MTLPNLTGLVKPEAQKKLTESAADKMAAEIQPFITFREMLKKDDPEAWALIENLKIGPAFNILCERYGLPKTDTWQMSLPDMCRIFEVAMTFHVDSKGAGSFKVLAQPELKKLMPHSAVPPKMVGAFVEVLARSDYGISFVRLVSEKRGGMTALIKNNLLGDADKKIRNVNFKD